MMIINGITAFGSILFILFNVIIIITITFIITDIVIIIINFAMIYLHFPNVLHVVFIIIYIFF